MSSVVTTPTDSFSELLPSCLSPPPSCLPPSFLFPPNYPITTAPDNAPFRPALALICFLLFSTQTALIIHNTYVLSLNYVQTANKYTALYASTMQFDRRANRKGTPPDTSTTCCCSASEANLSFRQIDKNPKNVFGQIKTTTLA